MENCQNCAFYDEEFAYCIGFGFHAPLNGRCEKYQPKLLTNVKVDNRPIVN